MYYCLVYTECPLEISLGGHECTNSLKGASSNGWLHLFWIHPEPLSQYSTISLIPTRYLLCYPSLFEQVLVSFDTLKIRCQIVLRGAFLNPISILMVDSQIFNIAKSLSVGYCTQQFNATSFYFFLFRYIFRSIKTSSNYHLLYHCTHFADGKKELPLHTRRATLTKDQHTYASHCGVIVPPSWPKVVSTDLSHISERFFRFDNGNIWCVSKICVVVTNTPDGKH